MKLIKKDSVATINAAGVHFQALENKTPHGFGAFWAHPQEQDDDGSLFIDISHWSVLLKKIGFKPE